MCNVEGCTNVAKPKQLKCNRHAMDPEKYVAMRLRQKNKEYTLHKKGHCELCGFVPKHPVQLDVDHIDGDKKNADPSNLMTLCANCHRLKTWENQEYKRSDQRGKNVVVNF